MVDMRLHILTVARDIMTEKGIKETSLKDIAKKAGISQGTLYYYYSAKEDIIYDIAENNLKLITDGLLALAADDNTSLPPEQILKTVFEKILDVETRGKLHLYLLSDAGVTNNALSEKFKERYNEWRKMLEYGLGKILPYSNENSEDVASVIIAMLDGFVIQKMLCGDNIPIDEAVKMIINAK